MHIENNRLRTNYYYSPNPQRRPLPKQKSRLSFVPFVLGITIVFAIAAIIFRARPSGGEADAISPKQPQTSAAAIQEQPPEPIKNITTDEEMAATINQVISASPDIDISVSIVDIDKNKSYHYGLDAQFDEASVGKLLTAVTYLHQVEKNETTLDKMLGGVSARANIQKMIELSDNVAWKNLNDFISHEYLMEYAQSIGINGYNADKNTIDSNSIALILSKLYKGTLLNKQNTQLLLGHMKNANRTDFIVASIPSGVSVYHKAGWLEDRNHDAAIIDDGHDPYVLVIFTNGHLKYHPVSAITIIQNITKATTARFISKA